MQLRDPVQIAEAANLVGADNSPALSEDPTRLPSLVHVLRYHALAQPNKVAYRFLADGHSEENLLTYGELDARARAIAHCLIERQANGQPVLLLYPPGLEYIAAFFGCLYAGTFAVPAYPPEPARLARSLPRLKAIASDSGARAVLAPGGVCRVAPALVRTAPELTAIPWWASDEMPAAPERWEVRMPAPNDLAFLQYTSGSTATPRGVCVSHANLMANQAALGRASRIDQSSVLVSWLPMYHDLGLIAFVLGTIYGGASAVLMAPFSFLQSPKRWLQAITRYRGTISGGPNFAYELLANRAQREDGLKDLDLSSWSCAPNGAEPIRPETLEGFAEAYASVGFRRSALLPCYGLAEATLMVSADARGKTSSVVGGHSDGSRTRPQVSCGHPTELEVAVVDPSTRRIVPHGCIGELWVRGPSVALGYWKRPEETRETFQAMLAEGTDEYLRTGDLGFVSHDGLCVAGRLKDLIIISGRNHYPQDIERTIERASERVRPSCVAAFSAEVEGEERLVVVFELRGTNVGDDLSGLDVALRAAIVGEHDLSIHALVCVAPGTILKTSSGKIRRRAIRASFLEGTLSRVERRSAVPDDDLVVAGSVAGVVERDAASMVRSS